MMGKKLPTAVVNAGFLLAFAAIGVAPAALAEDPAPPVAAREEPPSLLEVQFAPTGYAQLALWVEDAAGNFLATIGLTEAVALRGIGNRPGASQMNSGFRWPYGRREGVLPVWAQRRATAQGAKPFRRVIFKKRNSEGLASRTSDDFSRDDYFCLSFDTSRSRKDALDAVSCASIFNSDKGRFITEADVAEGYSEPYEDVATHIGRMQPLSLFSLYPPRRDVKACAPDCYEHADVAEFDAHARDVMPDIDAVTMATPKGDEPKTLLFSVPRDWPEGDYRACLEINVEGDENPRWNDQALPTPRSPSGKWDSWAMDYGYAYRGQPSVVYCVDFPLGMPGPVEVTTDEAEGSVASWDTASASFGELGSMDDMTDDPVGAPGSGADRLLLAEDGHRMKVVVKPPLACKEDAAPSAVEDVELAEHHDELHAHEWAELSFDAASDDVGVFRYEVRVSTDPMLDEETFMRGVPAKSATLEADELYVPADVAPGARVRVELGGLVALTHYYVGVRATDGCANASAIRVAEITTNKRVFATVTPCFVATAAYGTPLAAEISALRWLRDRHLASNAVGRAMVSFYEVVGPKVAAVVREHESLRAAARTLLSPLVRLAQWLRD